MPCKEITLVNYNLHNNLNTISNPLLIAYAQVKNNVLFKSKKFGIIFFWATWPTAWYTLAQIFYHIPH